MREARDRHRRRQPTRSSGEDGRARRADRREVLVDAAILAIRRHGPGASMDQLAGEAGVTKPILYRHFGDRSGLVAAVGERFAADLTTRLLAPLEAPTDDGRAVVRATIDAFLAFVEADPAVYRFLVQGRAAAPPDTVATLASFPDRVGRHVAFALGEALRHAGKDSFAAEPLAHGIVGFVRAAGDWWLERLTVPRARLVDELTSLLWGGLAGMGLGQAVTDPDQEEPR